MYTYKINIAVFSRSTGLVTCPNITLQSHHLNVCKKQKNKTTKNNKTTTKTNKQTNKTNQNNNNNKNKQLSD
jgi:hypothetical protein